MAASGEPIKLIKANMVTVRIPFHSISSTLSLCVCVYVLGDGVADLLGFQDSRNRRYQLVAVDWKCKDGGLQTRLKSVIALMA